MRTKRNKKGFSLIEVLMAVGTLAIGMIFIGGTFLVGIYFSTIATERTIAAVAADEAFAKIRIFRVNLNDPNLADINRINQQTPFRSVVLNPIDPNEFAYPSIKILAESRYCWSALCRRVDPNPSDRRVQVTVFVCRKVGSGTAYHGNVGRPIPMKVGVTGSVGDVVLTINEPGKINWINDGYTIVENGTGKTYQVVGRAVDSAPLNEITLAQPWQGGDTVWVVPPPIDRGRGPCIVVYQKVIVF